MNRRPARHRDALPTLTQAFAALDQVAPGMAVTIRAEMERARRQAMRYRIALRRAEAELAALRNEEN